MLPAVITVSSRVVHVLIGPVALHFPGFRMGLRQRHLRGLFHRIALTPGGRHVQSPNIFASSGWWRRLYGRVWNRCASLVLGANDRIRFGLIGAGGRGKEIFQVALGCPNAEAVAVADIYSRRLDEAQAMAPAVKTYNDYRRLLGRQVDRCGPYRHAATPARL